MVADRLDFVSSELKRGMVRAKIVRPSSGDFTVKVDSEGVTIFSLDKRRMIVSRVPSSGGTADESDEYYVPISRSTLFTSDGESASISVTPDAMKIRVRGDKKARQASFKRRSLTSKRLRIPAPPTMPSSPVNASMFSRLLRAVSCSAMVRQTKTEEEMRVNQIHFYGDRAFSSTRYQASMASLDGMDLDLSLVSSDVPSIRAFCSRVSGVDVTLGQDASRLYVIDPVTGSRLVISRVDSVKPPLSLFESSDFESSLEMVRTDFQKGFSWATTAIEGTQRTTVSVSDSFMRLVYNGDEIVSMPVSDGGKGMTADFPVGLLAAIAGYVESDTIILRFGHKSVPTILEITGKSQEIGSSHYVQSMKSR